MSKASITVITPPHGWQALNLAEVWQYRDLLWVWVKSQITARYKQSLLGVLWAVLNPLITMLIYATVFSILVRFPSGGVPYALFLFCGIVPWTFFQTCALGVMYSMTQNAGIMKKVYFPRLILPFAMAGISLFDFIFYFLILLIMLGVHIAFSAPPFIFAEALLHLTAFPPAPYFVVQPTIGVLMLPLFMAQVVIAAVGVGMLFGAFDAQFRDAGRVLTVLTNIWFWATPIIYASTQFNFLDGWLYRLNPMALVVEGFRWAFLGLPPPPASFYLSSLVALALFLMGAFYFKRIETTVMDVI